MIGVRARLRRGAATFWIWILLWHLAHAPWVVWVLRPMILFFALRCSKSMLDGTGANARRLLGPGSSAAERRRLSHAVIRNFFEFIVELGRGHGVEELRSRIESIEGREHYERARAAGRGTIVVTAHLGSFETGVAALREHEERVHVVFARDPLPIFERARAAQRERLGVIEAPVGLDWTMWVRLRDALRADEVILLQGDRVMPGQRGVRTVFFDGHVLLPAGPAKLALASGAPIVPVFAVLLPDGRVRIKMEEAVFVEEGDCPEEVTRRLGRVIEGYVRRYPEQWLRVDRAWCEDQESAASQG